MVEYGYTAMKTTIMLDDAVFRAAKKAALNRGVPFGKFVEMALHSALSAGAKPKPFRLRDGSFKGQAGVVPGVDITDWEQVRRIIYEGRGE